MGIIERPSPNHGPRRCVPGPDMVVLHYTGMDSGQDAAARLCDPRFEVSAHYLVDTDGTVLCLVSEDRRAWHAGASQWGDVVDVNSHSIGIEIVNPGHHGDYPPFPEPQMASVEMLLESVLSRWTIPPERVVGHACVAPGRKIDPGEKFDWRRLAVRGLAVWLDIQDRNDRSQPADAVRFARAARDIGYAFPEPAHASDWSSAVLDVWGVAAMRFLRSGRTSEPSAAQISHLEEIALRWPVVDRPSASA